MFIQKNFKTFFKKELSNRDFRFYLVTRCLATIAGLGFHLGLSWQILNLTNSPLALGFLGLAEFIPHLISAFWGGFIADKFYQKKIILYSLFAFSLVTGFIALINFLEIPNQYPNLGLVVLYTSNAFIGIIRGFYGPASSSYLSFILEREHYTKSYAWNNVIWQLAAVLGPAVGGIIYLDLGKNSLYLIIFILFILSFLNLSKAKHKGKIHNSESAINFINGLKKGFKFILSTEMLLAALLLDLFGVLFGGAVALLPIFADKILKVGPDGLGLLRSAPALGSFICSLFLVRLPLLRHTGKIYFFSMSAFGFCMIGFAISTNFILSLSYLFFSGAFDSVSVIVRNTLIQYLTPESIRGKIGAINTIFISSSNELGDFESGLTAHLWGIVRSVFIGGLLTQAVVLSFLKIFPSLKKMEFRDFQK